ncbi:hypothetical protein SEA_JACOREN57_49 [Mycobacterium phage JacoRen57]|nr:hypothetical protein SEA_JACOREN57_49 [Mycobacterium phage JacoRen57]
MAGVVVQRTSGTTVELITPYGTLLLSCSDELDASSVELLMSFTKELTAGAHDMIYDVDDNGIQKSVDYHTQIPTESQRIDELEEVNKLLYTLREIAETSEDAESVRVAFIALSTTNVGRGYLEGNPIGL